MCANCLSTADQIVCSAVLVAAVFKDPVHRALADLGLAAEPDPVKHEVRTVAFLYSLDLDPVEVLGQEMVDRAANWVPQPQPAGLRSLLTGLRWVLPSRSQSLLSVQ